MKWAIHAAAPCPVDVKRKMLDWWGPVIWEYYARDRRRRHDRAARRVAEVPRHRRAACGRSRS